MGFDEFRSEEYVHISQASQQFKASLDTIRRWEKKG